MTHDLDTKQVFRASLGPAPEPNLDLDVVIASARRQRRRRSSAALLGVAAGVAFVVGAGVVTGHISGVGAGGFAGQVAVAPSDDYSRPSPDSPFFRGLPPAVVDEVLANSSAQANVDILAPEERAHMWQGMVVNFTFCRQQFGAYEAWKASGVRPPAPVFTPPSQPVGDMLADWNSYYSSLRQLIESGDAADLASDLTGDASCGNWIPARPGDTNGPTIGDVVRGAPLPVEQRPWPATPSG